jgi:hypothetical protein
VSRVWFNTDRSALFVFFGALAGVGYVDPDAQAPADSEFVMGQPVFDPTEGQRLREIAMAEQRALEQQWAKKKRPNAVSHILRFD